MRRSISLFLVLGLVFSTQAFARGIALRFNFEKDKPLKYQLKLASEASFVTPDGQRQDMKMSNFLEITQELIEKKENGDFRVALTINKARQTVNGQDQPLPPGVEGQTQLITMKPTGEMSDMVAQNPAISGGQMQMVFPNRQLNEGDRWEQTQYIERPIPMEMKTLYELSKIETPYPGYPNPTVLVKSRMAMENKPGDDKEAVDSKTQGNMWFDAKRGCIVRSKAISKFQLNVPVQIPGLAPPNSTVKINVKLQVEIQLMD